MFSNITNFCVKTKTNIFLVEKDLCGPQYDRIKQPVDLRLLHTVAGRVKAFHRENEIYEAYMLDLSQYVGDRKRRELENAAVLEAAAKDKIRGASRIYAERSNQNGTGISGG